MKPAFAHIGIASPDREELSRQGAALIAALKKMPPVRPDEPVGDPVFDYTTASHSYFGRW